MPELSHLAREVYTHDRDLFLRSLFVPADVRESMLAVYALVVELERIPQLVSEEMIGHIRYAWWQEAIEALYESKATQGHPVLEGLTPLIRSGQFPSGQLISLVKAYRNAYPQPPQGRGMLIRDISLFMVSEAQKSWIRADNTINSHRKRYGNRLQSWLIIKLLIF